MACMCMAYIIDILDDSSIACEQPQSVSETKRVHLKSACEAEPVTFSGEWDRKWQNVQS